MTSKRSSGNPQTFVLTACGDRHVAHANLALAFLKRFCRRQEIVVVTSRTSARVKHDQVIGWNCPPELSNVQASRFLKTGLVEILGNLRGRYCYLDNDALAVSPEAGCIFEHFSEPVSFALDQSGKVTVEHFSPWALVHGDLRQAIQEKFQVEVAADWSIWNGGVFLFDHNSVELMTAWHEFTVAALADSQWRTRDQGTLVAAVWKHGLQHHATLSDVFNWMPRHSAGELDFSRLRFVHFIEGYGDPSWPEWRAVKSLLPEGPRHG